MTAVRHSSSDHPGWSRRLSRSERPVAACMTSDSHGSTSSATRQVTWPSPRCSRIAPRACQSCRWGGTRILECGVRCSQRSAREVSGLRRRPWRATRLGDVGPIDRIPSSRRRAASIAASRASMSCDGSGEGPSVRDGALDHAWVKAVEDGGHHGRRDRAQRCRPAAEVAHPAALEAERSVAARVSGAKKSTAWIGSPYCHTRRAVCTSSVLTSPPFWLGASKAVLRSARYPRLVLRFVGFR